MLMFVVVVVDDKDNDDDDGFSRRESMVGRMLRAVEEQM